MVISVTRFSRSLSSAGVVIAVAIGLAGPAYGQSNATATSTPSNAGAVQPSGPQPVVPPATTSSPSSSETGASPAPEATGPAATPPATPTPAEGSSAANATPETSPPMAKGVRRTADGRLAFSSSQPAAVELPGGRKRDIKSLLNVTKPLTYGEYVWDDKGVSKGRIWVLVDTARQLISVFRGKDEIGTAVTLYGADEFPTPAGRFRIMARLKDHYSRRYDNAPMPYTLRLTSDGVAIHGNNVLEGYASHGCVGVPLDFARRLFAEARIGDEVFILPGKDAKPKQK